MPAVFFKLFYNNKVVSLKQLDRVEEITVEQEENMFWEAKIKIPMCTNEFGRWNEGDEELIIKTKRIRVEVKVGSGAFTPLIDGPVVEYDASGSSQPGQSSVTFTIRDDSVYLNKEESIKIFSNQDENKFIPNLLTKPDYINSYVIDDIPDFEDSLDKVTVQRGTIAELLRQLAQEKHMYFGVLPGIDPGQSVGVFRFFPTAVSKLPALVLLGESRNIETLDIKGHTLASARISGAGMKIGDKSIFSIQSKFRNVDLLGKKHAFDKDKKSKISNGEESETSHHILRKTAGESALLSRLVNSEAERKSYTVDGSGSVIADCYDGILQPYNVVQVKAVKDRLVGHYRISQVTHMLTRSNYSQSFKLKRNAYSEASKNGTIKSQGKTIL